MHDTTTTVARRSLLTGAAGAAAGLAVGAGPLAEAAAALAPAGTLQPTGRLPLWRQAGRKGIVFGSSIATWQLDKGYRGLHDREAGLLFTEDDLLWYQLKPKPKAPLNFEPGDQIIGFAERNDQLVIAAHLAWDEGFGEGWTDADLWDLNRQDAEDLLYGVVRAEVEHYQGRVNGWIVANEVTDPNEADKHGFRKNVPWYSTIGPGYIAECFHIAAEKDPGALRIINEFGFETVNEWGDRPGPRQRAYLKAIDRLLDQGAPVQAVGIQGHLLADRFAQRFHERRYRNFLREIADRGLPILVTELDVLDEGLPKNPRKRDRKVADVYRRYLDVTLDESAVKVVVAFGLTDRYTWLDEDQPREDGSHRRPLAFDRRLNPKPAYHAISRAFRHAPVREPLWQLEK
ncbi:endo-1,4-beta-xylanase [Nocardioides sp. YIM 152315]|uniref:endo-1,4-beta-xylanase n=1 Tax=Nocardioides sp. YIM 152315 TaxID=3031760 RepID=UPI0023DA7AB4|nr:endo-1,4-beta-xylanase [Nocardioides sp. YIM 152315]MDF1605421.1 endo-1,4-beta-xylanase [Nocardioides sp. YIM 152315]